jgi:sugar phosphate isomerase/epimerase
MIQFFCPRWGSESLDWEAFFNKVLSAGYDGVEYGIASTTSTRELDEVWALAERMGVKLIAQHYDTYTADVHQHFGLYQAWLDRMKDYPVVKVNSQTGRDFFSFEDNKRLIEMATRFTADTGVEVVHETHRNKFSFAAHVTGEYLKRIPSLQLALDASHWVCVAESYLDDQQEVMQLAIGRTGHLHARVGYPEGPQVPDPRAPEWQEALQAHLRWWDEIVRLRPGSMTITPEFGPYPYTIEQPYSRQPLGNQWDINVWMMGLLKDRYASK